jgi:hypothetical protein
MFVLANAIAGGQRGEAIAVLVTLGLIGVQVRSLTCGPCSPAAALVLLILAQRGDRVPGEPGCPSIMVQVMERSQCSGLSQSLAWRGRCG